MLTDVVGERGVRLSLGCALKVNHPEDERGEGSWTDSNLLEFRPTIHAEPNEDEMREISSDSLE